MKFAFRSAANYYKTLEENGATLVFENESFLEEKKLYTIDANSIEDILKLADICGDGIIISKTYKFQKEKTGCDYEIMIYDGWIE